VLIDIHEIADFADYFILCTASSDRMLQALAEAVLDETKKEYKIRGQLEGKPHDGWLVVDYGDIVVHLFTDEQRAYYQLEELWATGKVLLHVQ